MRSMRGPKNQHDEMQTRRQKLGWDGSSRCTIRDASLGRKFLLYYSNVKIYQIDLRHTYTCTVPVNKCCISTGIVWPFNISQSYSNGNMKLRSTGWRMNLTASVISPSHHLISLTSVVSCVLGSGVAHYGATIQPRADHLLYH